MLRLKQHGMLGIQPGGRLGFQAPPMSSTAMAPAMPLIDGLTFPQVGLYAPDQKPKASVKLPMIKHGLMGEEPQQPLAPVEERSTFAPAQQAAGQSTDDKFMALLNNPMLQMGMNLLGSSSSPNPWGQALNNTLAAAAQAAQARRQQSLTDLDQKRFGLDEKRLQQGERALELQERGVDSDEAFREVQMMNMEAQAALHNAQADAAQREQEMISAYMGGGVAPPQAGAQAGQIPPNPQQMPPQAGQMASLPQQGFQLPPGVSMDAVRADLVFNRGKGLPAMLAKANEPIAGANGIMYRRGPNGMEIDPTSLDAYKQMQAIEKGTSAALDLVEVPMSNGTKVMMPRSQAASVLSGNTGEIKGNNYGNIRPPGASTGFQAYNSPEEGIAAIDKNLQAYGKAGVNTLRGVISRWAPPNENDTEVLIANASKRLSLKPDQRIDLTNPATRQAISSAIMLQEHGNKIFSSGGNQPPQIGVTQAPTDTLEGTRVKNETMRVEKDVEDARKKREMERADATQALQTTTHSLNKLASSAKTLMDHPGLSLNTGYSGAIGLYKLPGDGRDAHEQLEKLKSQVVVESMKELKNASVSFSPLTDKDAARLEKYVSNLSEAQTLPSMKSALQDIIDFAAQSNKTISERYKSIYGEQKSATGTEESGTQVPEQAPMSLEDYLKSKRKKGG